MRSWTRDAKGSAWGSSADDPYVWMPERDAIRTTNSDIATACPRSLRGVDLVTEIGDAELQAQITHGGACETTQRVGVVAIFKAVDIEQLMALDKHVGSISLLGVLWALFIPNSSAPLSINRCPDKGSVTNYSAVQSSGEYR